MNKLRILIVAVFAVSGWILSNEAGADAGADLLKAKGCVNCHDAEKKKVGPSFKDIAAKKPNAGEVAAKMVSGKGHPKVTGTEAEAKTAVEAALATK